MSCDYLNYELICQGLSDWIIRLNSSKVTTETLTLSICFSFFKLQNIMETQLGTFAGAD